MNEEKPAPSFTGPEGSYILGEEHKPTHMILTSNQPAPYPCRVSLIVIRFPTTKNAVGFAGLLGGNKDKEARSKKEEREREQKERERAASGVANMDGRESISSSDNADDMVPPETTVPNSSLTLPAAADGPTPASSSTVPLLTPFTPPALFSPSSGNAVATNGHSGVGVGVGVGISGGPGAGAGSGSGGAKRKTVSRPKHSIRTTSSSFVTRLQTAEGLTRTLANKQGDVTFMFYNALKSFFWTEVGVKAKEYFARLTFSAYPTCHDVNQFSSSAERVDVVVGFATGDLIWFDPISSRYVRINKQGSISNSPCTCVRWVPGSASLFLVSHADGTIIVYEKDREDGPFTPRPPPTSVSSPLPHPQPQNPNPLSSSTSGGSAPSHGDSFEAPWDPMDDMFVTPNHAGGAVGLNEKGPPKKNPVSHWRVSKKSIIGFVFSPDVRYVAAVSEDGCLRIIDALSEKLVDSYASYFGSLTCVAWSPDGRFILTGGQDDLITIISPWEQRVIARCQGHSSFVSSIAFDEVQCDGRTYRFGSVGEDNKLLLWDFSSGALHRPKPSTLQNRQSLSSTISLALRRRNDTSVLNLPMGPGSPDANTLNFHPAPPRNEVAVLQPILVHPIEGDLEATVLFLPNGILTGTRIGLIKIWTRPTHHQHHHGKESTVTGNGK